MKPTHYSQLTGQQPPFSFVRLNPPKRKQQQQPVYQNPPRPYYRLLNLHTTIYLGIKCSFSGLCFGIEYIYIYIYIYNGSFGLTLSGKERLFRAAMQLVTWVFGG